MVMPMLAPEAGATSQRARYSSLLERGQNHRVARAVVLAIHSGIKGFPPV